MSFYTSLSSTCRCIEGGKQMNPNRLNCLYIFIANISVYQWEINNIKIPSMRHAFFCGKNIDLAMGNKKQLHSTNVSSRLFFVVKISIYQWGIKNNATITWMRRAFFCGKNINLSMMNSI